MDVTEFNREPVELLLLLLLLVVVVRCDVTQERGPG